MDFEAKKQSRLCDFCKAVEGKPRLVGNFIVSLHEITLHKECKLVCQSCRIKNNKIRTRFGLIPLSNNLRYESQSKILKMNTRNLNRRFLFFLSFPLIMIKEFFTNS